MRELVIALVLVGGATAAAADTWTPHWTLSGLDAPESVVASPDGRTLYVSNVGGEGDVKDGNGVISRVSRDGKLIDKAWVTGMDAPKGLALKGGRLYAADIDRIVEIDAATGRIAARHPAPGATFLNDLAVAPDGTLLAADSGTGRIFALAEGKVTVWAAAPELRAINGLLPEPGRLLATTMQGRLVALDYRTKAVKVLAEELGDADGIAPAGGGAYYVGEWPGRLFRVTPDGQASTLIDSRKSESYINDFMRLGDLLIVPRWKPGELVAYRLTE